MPVMNENSDYKILQLGKAKQERILASISLLDSSIKHFACDTIADFKNEIIRINPQLIIVDFDSGTSKILKFLSWLLEDFPVIKVIGITEINTLNIIVSAIKLGVHYVYNIKEEPHKLSKEISSLFEQWKESKDGRQLLEEQKQKFDFSNIIGASPEMMAVFELISKVVRRKWVTVLIRGETGTGKELIARSIHYNTCTQDQPFVEINCSALPETLLESELFGYEKGAFTDAKNTKMGLFELAQHGTLFLDEIGDLSPKVQIKLLKALEEKTIRRVGGTKDIKINTRIISATNRDLQAAIKTGDFRTDLFYRLNVLFIQVPPLRERGEDVLLLARHFLRQFSEEYESPVESFTSEAEEMLMHYMWPGNVRELRHTVERVALLGDDRTASKKDVEQTIDSETPLVMSEKKETNYLQLEIPPAGISLDEGEKIIIDAVLKKVGWNKRRTCRILQISRPRLDRKIEKYNLKPEND